nr:hypothetical protein [Neisseria perflava]
MTDIIKDPYSDTISHSKLWANIACAAATYKFAVTPEMPSEIWAIYLGVVGGYAVARSLVAVKRKEVQQHEHELE